MTPAAASGANPASTSSECLVADTYSLTDAQLAESIEFIEEIGFGNWGSVWSCRSRLGSSRRKLAVKLIHRTNERTTAARVRSIWNEMKIVRTLRDDRHPAIIDFHSFIITPSYALITMEYLPRLVPVEVREPKAKTWFESLLGGVAHLHARGIVHNDIKPANILLSRTEQPVLVDFGFAERYELLPDAESFVEVVSPSKSSPARTSTPGSASRRSAAPKESSTSTKPVPFESSLAYGTPEYLSPERARGYKHDTRKSDTWSLGVTFFEIITGRTPFELDDNEEFTSKEDLERYWARTNSGSWVGSWKMTAGLENLLVKMLRPNAAERILAKDALLDPYFAAPIIDAEITAVRMTATGKDIQRILTLAADQAPSTSAASSRPASPMTGTTRSKLSAIQNLMTKQPHMPGTFPRISAVQRRPSIPIRKDTDADKSVSIRSAQTPVDKPLPAIVEKPKSRSFFSTHKRTKSAATTSGGATPLTPKATAPAPPPRVPPPTPCTPNIRHHETEAPPVPVAAAAVLQKQALEKHGVVVIEPQADPRPGISANVRKTRTPSPTASPTVARTSTPTPVTRLRVPVPSQAATNSSKVLTPIRSALRPVPGKENVSNVKVKVRAFESRTAASATNTSVVPAVTGVKPRVGEKTPTKGGLRLKDRNRVQEKVEDKPTGLSKGKQPEPDSGGSKTLAPKRSLLRKKPSTLIKKENIQPPQPAPEDKQASRGRRALHAISRSVDLTRPRGESPMNHFRHSVRKSIDKTAELFGHKVSSAGTNSISRRAPRAQKTTAELKELQDSWDDLAKDRVFQSVVQLPTVADTSTEENSLPAAKEPLQDDVPAEETSKRSSRLAIWIQDVEKVASETREELEREVSTAMSRRSSSGTLLFDSAISSKRSTEPTTPSLPPPKRRGSVSSQHARSRNHSLQDLLASGPGTRLSAVADDDRSERSGKNGMSQKALSVGSIESSIPPTEMPTIPTIPMEDIPGMNPRTDNFYACEQANRQSDTMLSHQLEVSRDSTLDLSRLAEQVGVNRHPWSTPRSSRAPTPRASTSTPTPACQPSIQIVTPPTPKRPAQFDRVLLSTDNVVRVGNGYESLKSHRGRSPTSSSSFYRARQSMENITSRDSSDHPEGRSFSRNAESQSGSTRAKKASHRRSSIFATLRGRQHIENTGISSASYFASADADFGVIPPVPPPHDSRNTYDELGRSTPQQRANTLTGRLKKAFMRVVSTQDINRAATIGVVS